LGKGKGEKGEGGSGGVIDERKRIPMGVKNHEHLTPPPAEGLIWFAMASLQQLSPLSPVDPRPAGVTGLRAVQAQMGKQITAV